MTKETIVHINEVAAGATEDRLTVSAVLLDLGISTQYNGFEYLVRIIPLLRDNPLQSLSKVLYPKIATDCGGGMNAVSVERAIRVAIQEGWSCRDEKIWRVYFPADGSGQVPRPSNREFISRLASLMELWTGAAYFGWIDKKLGDNMNDQ